MREILFRGKRLDNGKWVEGYLYEHEPALVCIVSENYVPEPSKWFIARTGFADWNMPRPVEFVEVDPSTVGQYTGLTNKNGKRIFEGDIVRLPELYGNGKAVIRFCSTAFRACGEAFTYQVSESMEVIGNLHENPELL